jgi:hypothetical protein
MPLRGGLLSEFFKAWEIYRSDGKMKSRERASVPLPAFLGIDEFQPDIPRQVGLHQPPAGTTSGQTENRTST